MRALLGLALAAMVATAAAGGSDLYRLVDDLFSRDAAVRSAARDELIARNDPSIAAALVEAVFYNTAGQEESVAVLEHLLGEKHGSSFRKWVEAIGRREDLRPAPGYVAFKARMVAKIDPALAEFLKEDAPRTIRPEEIVWGGVIRDGIPALDRPRFIEASRATWLSPDEPVFGVVVAGDARAYPERILAWHEMANDRIGGRPVSLSYCTLCGAAIAYGGEASDGRTYTFGSSGFLYRSNKLMYDRRTGTLWSQLTGEPVFGPLVAKKLEPLRVLPLTVTTWREWRAAHPKTRVLSLETGYVRDYRPGAAYGSYLASPDTMFPVWKKVPSSLAIKDSVLVVNVGSVRKLYPVDALRGPALVHDRVGGKEIVLIGERAYESGGRRFRREGAALIDPATGERFTVGEESLSSQTGTRLPRVPSHRAFWFGAYAFYPGTELWQPHEE
ncbi:MAG TPA: DUF3179 domain-containing protein [Thermoanaerobaculia bacterium]|nr:DUF3179 domain-containing protein [Thermoanaerobaculia bacterium]